MTELEKIQRAKMYMDKLAYGIDPITDTEIPVDSVLNQVRLVRCFLYVSGILDKVIANGGEVGAKPKVKLHDFYATCGQMSMVPISEEPLRITQIIENINRAIHNPQMKKLNTTIITNWLLKKGFLEKRPGQDGKERRAPSTAGILLGLSTQIRRGQYGEYEAVLYNAEAQRFLFDHIESILDRGEAD